MSADSLVKEIYLKIDEARQKGIEAALCIIVSCKGSTPRKTGAKMLVYENGSIYGTIGGGNLEKKVIENALEVIRNRESKLFRHDLLHQHSMCCGGNVEIYIEPVMKKNKLYIFGAGHTGQALAKISSDHDFEIVLIDDRKEYMDECKIPEVNKMNLPFQQALALLPFDERTFVSILTYSHELDRDILGFCLNKPHAYLGMIGSKRKTEVTRKMFAEAKIGTEEKLNRVDMPMGIDINAETAEEIAVSILAKLIEVKNKVITNK